MPNAKLGKILTHGRITPIVQTILNAPMPAHQFQEAFGRGAPLGQARRAIPDLATCVAESASVARLSSLNTCASAGHVLY